MPYAADFNSDECIACGACRELIPCPRGTKGCIGCGACVLACPNEAIEMVEVPSRAEVRIEVDGREAFVQDRISIGEALELLGYTLASAPGHDGVFAPCRVGGCWNCAVEVDGSMKRSCITPVRDGLVVQTSSIADRTPQRVVHGFTPQEASSAGTPWDPGGTGYVEVACFTAGCNFRCPQCLTWRSAYRGRGTPMTPEHAAETMTEARGEHRVDRMSISGGECTLNRPWLVSFVRGLRALNPDKRARIHVDTNGSLLTPDYIDELVAAGMTDVSVDLKGLETDTFMRITGLTEMGLADRYKETAWNACKYVIQRHRENVFLGAGIPYNRDLISMEELSRIGTRIRDELDPSIQVCVLRYTPEFRSTISRPTYDEMNEVLQLLRGLGLTNAICQTESGIIGPQ